MIGNELYEPLKRRPGRRRRGVPSRLAVVGLVAVAAVTVVVWRYGDTRGEPVAVATIGRTEMTPVAPAPPAAPATTGSVVAFTAPSGAAPTGETPAQAVDVENGVTVVRSATGGGPMILKVPPPRPSAAAGQGLARATDPRLVEPSAFGLLPKIGRDGARSDHVYAHGAVPLDGRPGIAILVGGMGLDRQTTADAGTLLPDAVSFGFAPYGDDLADQVSKARQAGHEIVLQAPMEGFGPAGANLSHMLLAESGNGDRLRWLMGRFTGYAGLGNYLGARLLSDDNALRPILAEAAGRGLLFVDDGTAPQSVASSVAAELRLPVVRADVVLDAKADAAAMAAAFARLEALARERGVAVGSATGHPETVAALAHFLAEAGKRGIVLIPVTQAASLETASPVASKAGAASH